MRFLKTKIQNAQAALKNQLAKSQSPLELPVKGKSSPTELNIRPSSERIRRLRSSGSKCEIEEQPKLWSLEKRKEDSATKNIIVNYANAITAFAISPLAIPYLQTRLETEGLTLKDFISFINLEKTKIGGICSFRARLLVEDGDNEQAAACKRVFQWIAEVFIKYYSVNWIIHGKVSHKETYMKYRFKMLRRVKNPEAFTYLKERAAKKI